MKNTLLLSSLLLAPLTLLPAIEVPFPTDTIPLWIEQFNKYDMKPSIKKLGYDPAIRLHCKPRTKPLADTVTVYAHGWGDSQKTIDYLHRNAAFLPDTIVGFDFVDANFGAFLPSYKKSNFCQSGDIAPLVMVLAMLDNCGLETINLTGHSRGAGTILTTLARLKRYARYRRFFQKLGISKPQAARILEKVRRGVIILNCPLIDIDTIIKDKLGWFKMDWATPLVRGCFVPVVTKYHPSGDSPLKAAWHLCTSGFTILIYTEQQDMIVGNKNDAQLYTILESTDTYFCIGNDTGHVHTSSTLATASQALYNRYLYGIDDTSTDMLDELQPFPGTAAELCTYHAAMPTLNLRIHERVAQAPWLEALEAYPLTPLVKQFGYNPAIRVYPSDAIVHNRDQVTLYAHGYGEYPQAILPFLQLNSHMVPGTIVSFNFPDVVEGSFVPNLRKSSVAQTGDIRSFALMLKLLDECGLQTIHLMGTSRGGGTILNTLGRLCTYEKHAPFFAEIGISPLQAEKILNKVHAGTIVINCAFIDSRASAYYWLKEWGQWALETFLYPWIEHRLTEDQGIESAALIKDRNFTILVHFEHNDKVVGNSRDAAFYKTIMGPNTYLVLGNDGGHLHSGKTLGAALQAFRYKHGGAYYHDPYLLARGVGLLAQEDLIRLDVDAYVHEVYTNWS